MQREIIQTLNHLVEALEKKDEVEALKQAKKYYHLVKETHRSQ